jgi:putative tricarboxylic transport membrane protein
MLVIINLPLIGMWVKFLKVPYHLLFPMIVLFCCIGIYSVNSRPSDVLEVAAFGAVGYVFFRLRFELAPLLLGLVLGAMLEDNLRRGLILNNGNVWSFLSEPLTLALLTTALLALGMAVVPSISKGRQQLVDED